MLKLSPGKEEDLRHFQEWLEASAALDRVVEITEPADGPLRRWPTATDMLLSRLFDSVRNGASAEVRSRAPDRRPAWARGGSPCGQTYT
jgi:hypothetical protein